MTGIEAVARGLHANWMPNQSFDELSEYRRDELFRQAKAALLAAADWTEASYAVNPDADETAFDRAVGEIRLCEARYMWARFADALRKIAEDVG